MNCSWCGDEFDSNSSLRRLTHKHYVFNRPMRADVPDASGKRPVYFVSGPLCCRCRNIERASVPDKVIGRRIALTDTATTHHYPKGFRDLVVESPGVQAS